MTQQSTPPDPSSGPQTPAGRRILLQDFRGNSAYTITRAEILNIEQEAATIERQRVVERLTMREMSVGTADAYSKKSVQAVLLDEVSR